MILSINFTTKFLSPLIGSQNATAFGSGGKLFNDQAASLRYLQGDRWSRIPLANYDRRMESESELR